MSFGDHIRNLREDRKMLQRELSSKLQMDMGLLSKIERGTRKARREQVIAFADAFDIEASILEKLWLVEQVVELIQNESDAIVILKAVKKEIELKETNRRK